MSKPIYRMSSIGYCPRALSAEHLNLTSEPAPSWLQMAADEGKLHEGWIKTKLREHEHIFGEQQELKLSYSDFDIVGHIDGLIEDYDHQRDVQLLEIKSMSHFEFQRWMHGRFEEFPAYAAQITCYQQALKKDGKLMDIRYYVKNRSSGYIDTFTTSESPAIFQEIIDKITKIEESVARGELIEREYLPESLECKRCRYKAICIPSLAGEKSISIESLSNACEKWRMGQLMINKGDQLVKEAKEVFITQGEVSGLKKWKYDNIIVNKIDVKESVTYSKGRLLQIFTEEQLKPASEIKLPYSYLRIDDLRRDE